MKCRECKDEAPPLTKDFVSWECSCFKNNQPERLNPEGHFREVAYDSLNTEYK